MSGVRLIANSLLACFVLAAPAMAADVAIENAQIDWSGPYLGVTGSYAFGSVNGNTGCCADTFDISGLQLGGIAGYNFGTDRLLAGIEADASIVDIDGTGFNGGIQDHNVFAMSRARARLGLPVENMMFFVAAGLSLAAADVDTIGNSSRSQLHLGWNAGIGAEYAMNQRLNLRAEYIFDGLTSKTYRFSSDTVDIKWTANTIRLAVVMRF